MSTRCLTLLFIILYLSLGNALECYVCENQEGNREKCLNTISTCEQGQDTCLTHVKWGSTPYWSPEAKKQYYISKSCTTKKECQRMKHKNGMVDCIYLKYQDWQCYDCCQGDRCNYYIISSASKYSISLATLFAITLVQRFSSWIMH